jgi:hypothetical protein
MNDVAPQQPLTPDPPVPPGPAVEAPDLSVDAPSDEREWAGGTAVSAQAGTLEAPD